LDQLNVPASTTTPPMLVPWPPMNLVAEWITMSAPHSIGRHRYGVAKVLSTISGRSFSCAIDATVSMSSTLPAGLPIVSPKKAFVFGRTACRHASGSSGSTQVSSTLILRNRCLSWLTVPPYSAVDETTWSPGWSSVKSAAACAAIPLEKATAPAPPSRLATRSSNTATVGFMMRE
jgi:hypothetical protein